MAFKLHLKNEGELLRSVISSSGFRFALSNPSLPGCSEENGLEGAGVEAGKPVWKAL